MIINIPTLIIVNDVKFVFRLYETEVKKVIKVQSMLRAFITKKKMAPKLLKQQSGNDDVLVQS